MVTGDGVLIGRLVYIDYMLLTEGLVGRMENGPRSGNDARSRWSGEERVAGVKEQRCHLGIFRLPPATQFLRF